MERGPGFRQIGLGVFHKAAVGANGANRKQLTTPASGETTESALVVNEGPNKVAVAFGADNTVVCAFPTEGTPANGQVILPGSSATIDKSGKQHFDIITLTGNSIVYVYQGKGA